MTKISTVLFDLGDVLFRFNPDRRLQLMSSVSGISETILHARLWASGFSDECDAGRYTAQGMYRKACDLLDWHEEYF